MLLGTCGNLPEPIHTEIDRRILDEPKNGGRNFLDRAIQTQKKDGFLNKEVIKDLCGTFDDGEENKNQPFEFSDSYKKMDEGVFRTTIKEEKHKPERVRGYQS